MRRKQTVSTEPDGPAEIKTRIPVWLYPSALEVTDRAAGMEISDNVLHSLRGRCVQNVKKTNGSVTPDKAVEYQRGGA